MQAKVSTSLLGGGEVRRAGDPVAQDSDPVARDGDAVARFVERFASVLADSGIPRMPARVFVALLATDSGRLTAAELAARLRVSPAAISGAVRYLVQVNLASRAREPGSRRDYYWVQDDVWYEAVMSEDKMLTRWQSAVREGVEVLGSGTPAGARMVETLDFFEFLQTELPALLERWRTHKAGRPRYSLTPTADTVG